MNTRTIINKMHFFLKHKHILFPAVSVATALLSATAFTQVAAATKSSDEKGMDLATPVLTSSDTGAAKLPPRRIILVDVGFDHETDKTCYRPWLHSLKKNGATEIIEVATKHSGGTCSVTLARYSKLCNDLGLDYKCFDWEDIRTTSSTQHEEFKSLGSFEGVISCHEPSVEIADELSLMLNLDTTNLPTTSTARHEKLLMQETIAKAGLRHIKSFFATDSKIALKYIEQNFQFPILLKPDRSSASVGVTVCNNAAEVQESFGTWIGADLAIASGYIGLTGIVDGLVVQEFLTGEEYVVNVVSRNGKHVVTDMWRKHTVGKDRLYDRETLCSSSEKHPNIVSYVCDVLVALGIDHGPTHVEIMLTKEGPTLIELGTRISGGVGAEHGSVPLDTIEAIAEAYLQPEHFHRRPLHYHALEAKTVVFLTNPENPFPNFKKIASVFALPSFSHVWRGALCGIPMRTEANFGAYQVLEYHRVGRKTTDLFSIPGKFVFAHESQEQVNSDVKKVQAMKSTFFEEELPADCVAVWLRGNAKPAPADEKLICDCQAWTHWMEYEMYNKVHPTQMVLNFTGNVRSEPKKEAT